MGQLSSWIGIQGVAQADLFAELGLEETGEEGDYYHVARPFSFCEMPGGWLILHANDFDWAKSERVRELSRFGPAIGGQYDDQVTNSTALCAAKNGESLWRVVFPFNEDDRQLAVIGSPPPELAQVIRDSTRSYAEGEDEQEIREEIGFEVPLALGETLCGFRYDDGDYLFRGLKIVPGGWAASVNVYDNAKARRSFRRKLVAAIAIVIALLIARLVAIAG